MIKQETIRTTLGVLTLMGAAAGLYVGIQATQATQTEKVESLAVKSDRMQERFEALAGEVDVNRETLVKVETEIVNTGKNYDRLANTMDDLGKEIRTLSNTIIRMGVKDGG